MATVTATLGATTLTSTITIAAAPTGGLIINEIDYDMPGAGDAVEFVELLNTSTAAIDLTGKALIFVNGSGTPAEYRRIDLGPAGSIPAGGYLVIGAAAVTSPPGTKYTPPVGSGAAQWPATDAIQNGSAGVSAPGDGLLVVDTTTMTVFDRLSYESAVTVNLTGFGSVDLFEMAAPTAGDDPTAPASMVRIPNGTDTNNSANDWRMTATVTPGLPNVP
jgi:hypothetical protein